MFVTCLGRIGRARSHPKSTGLGHELAASRRPNSKIVKTTPYTVERLGLISIKEFI
jgi:hypothetical protein